MAASAKRWRMGQRAAGAPMVRLLLLQALQPSMSFDRFLNGLARFNAFDISGREVTGERLSYAGGDPQGLSFTHIDLTLDDSSSLVSNNLGGMGPSFSDPPYIRMRDVGLVRGLPIRCDTVPNFFCTSHPRIYHPRFRPAE